MDDIAKEVIRVQGEMQSERANFDSLYAEIARYIMPEYNGFNGDVLTNQVKSRIQIFDSTAASALDKLSSALNDMLTPRNQIWHNLETNIKKINENREFQLWAEEVVEILFAERYSPRSNFASQIIECYRGLGAFGTTGIFVDEHKGALRYRSEHLADLYIRENAHGLIDRAHRKLKYTAEQAADKFGGMENLPEVMQKAAKASPNRKFDFIHCIKPNPNYDPESFLADRMQFLSVYVAIDGQKVVQKGGYRKFRLPVSRYVTSPRQTYGSSPAIRALPDIKTLNEMEKTILQQGHKSVAPPLLAASDAVLAQFSMVPAHINYGALDENGREKVKEMTTGSNFPLGLEMSDRRREIINDAFLVNLFQILVETPSMTATEVMERAKEKGMLLAPTGGRQQSELLGGIIECEIDILDRMGKLPPKPAILEDAGAEVSVIYTSPLNQAQRAGEGAAIARTFEAVTPLAQIDPTVLDPFNLPKISRELADINGFKPSLLYSEEELAEKQRQKAEREQAEALLNAAPVTAQTAKGFAEAQALSQTPSNLALPNIIPQ